MYRLLSLTALLTALCYWCGPLKAADWPCYLGPDHNDISSEIGLNKHWTETPPKVAWSFAMSDNGYAGVAIAHGRAFIVDHKNGQDIVRALDVTNGHEVLNYPYDEKVNDNYGFCRCTPTVTGGKVYTASRMGIVNCLDEKTGTKIWTRDMLTDFHGKHGAWDYAASVLIDGENAIVCPGGSNAAVAALNKETGATIWSGGGSDKAGYATPVPATINGVKQYVVFTGVSVIGVSAESGALLWSYLWNTSYDINAATPIILGNDIFVTSGYGHGSARLSIDKDGVTPRWTSKAIMSRMSAPVLVDGNIYATSENGQLTCLDAQTGQAKWSQPGFAWGTLLAADGVLLVVAANTADLVMVKAAPDAYQELGRVKPASGKDNWTHPSLANGQLLMRTKQQLVCVNLGK